MESFESLFVLAINAAIESGKAILNVYKTDFNVEIKSDLSPLTTADRKAHKIIVECLKESGLPVLSEEGKEIPFKIREKWDKFWLVDPLDGTKEFIKRNGEFTVNIALIKKGIPILGIIYAPVPDILYWGEVNSGAFKIDKASQLQKKLHTTDDWKTTSIQLPLNQKNIVSKVVASRSHLNKETSEFIDDLKSEHNKINLISIGSSLKLCLIAEGTADIYPRFAPTMEWDIAAGHAIIAASGGRVRKAKDKSELVYNKENLLNPWFIAYRKNL